MKYEKFKYIYPPRPKNAVPLSEIDNWDNGSMIGQPKMNGSNMTAYLRNDDIIIMNRHGQLLSNYVIGNSEIKELYRGNGGWTILNGEYLNKQKCDENGNFFNHKFVIFDILSIDGDHLIGKTFSERIELLDNLYGVINSEKDYLYSISENVYRVKSYLNGFKDLFDRLSKIDIIEGLVCKRRNGRLENGIVVDNNSRSQIKFRKPTKNYRY